MKTKLIIEHYKIFKKGKYTIANRILEVLRKCRIRLNLGDTDWEVEQILNKIGLKMGEVGRYGDVEYTLRL